MIKKISINQYRKLNNIEFDFTPGVNIISGTNGTCKTSLLHIISNSFQAITKKCTYVNDSKCIETIKNINIISNPKIESLTKGDKEYNDPAIGFTGALYTVEYFNHQPLSFRKHNSDISNRYSIKPYYKKGTKDSLPFCPVIYLGLARLFPFGEYQDDGPIEKIKKSLPIKYQQEVNSLYKEFTHMNISLLSPQKMGDIKIRFDFTSDVKGIDSNTISAGEDNLYMLLTALVSLRYYFESINSENDIESILLIDELDATLHPSYQFKLLELFKDYAAKYKIQIIFTTHSLSLLEFAMNKKQNIAYLVDNITTVHKMIDPDIYAIKRFLHNKSVDDIYQNNVIPVYTEDEEARIFLNVIFDYFEKNMKEFINVRRFFYFVNANIGANNLINIFNDKYLSTSTMKSICILDGDQRNKRNVDNYIIVLPGESSPEKFVMEYAIKLLEIDDLFWTNETILSFNYGKANFLSNRKPDIDSIDIKLQTLRSTGESTHGVERSMRKKIFNKHQRFFELLFTHWVNNPENQKYIQAFYEDLHLMFLKTSDFHGINPKEWDFKK